MVALQKIDAALGSTDIRPAMPSLTTTAPASIEVGRRNEYYATQEEFVTHWPTLKVEYEAIAAAGFKSRSMTRGWPRLGSHRSPWASMPTSVTA